MDDNTARPGTSYDVAIVGAGAAGLAAAAMLGRSGRQTVLIGQPDRENSAASEVHNLPYAEGVAPDEFYASIEREVARYGVVQVTETVTKVLLDDERRHAVLSTPTLSVTAARLLIATGVWHEIPNWVPHASWGRSVFACPFCHAYEHRGEDFLVVGPSVTHTLEFALLCPPHARSMTVLLPGPDAATGLLADRIRAMNGRVMVDTVASATPLCSGELAITTAGGDSMTVGAVALFGTIRMRSELVTRLGLCTDAFGIPEVDDDGRSSHPLVWIAGNAAKPHYVLVEAMGSGLRAGMSIHQDLALDRTF